MSRKRIDPGPGYQLASAFYVSFRKDPEYSNRKWIGPDNEPTPNAICQVAHCDGTATGGIGGRLLCSAHLKKQHDLMTEAHHNGYLGVGDVNSARVFGRKPVGRPRTRSANQMGESKTRPVAGDGG